MTCFKTIEGQPKILKTYQAGDVFGELALLYNAPRAATIRAETDGSLWVLDRGTFYHIVKDAATKRRQKFEEFLGTVPILQNMDRYERSKLGDAIKEVKANEGTQIIKQGDQGDSFYIILEGEATAIKDSETVMAYKSGDFFGELALLRGEPRAASIWAKTDCKLLTLDRKSFKRLLGPLDLILRRNMGNYLNYI